MTLKPECQGEIPLIYSLSNQMVYKIIFCAFNFIILIKH